MPSADSTSSNEDNPYRSPQAENDRSPQADNEGEEMTPVGAPFPQNAIQALILQTALPAVLLVARVVLYPIYLWDVYHNPISLILGMLWGFSGILLTLGIYARTAARRSVGWESAGRILAVVFTAGSMVILWIGPPLGPVKEPLGPNTTRKSSPIRRLDDRVSKTVDSSAAQEFADDGSARKHSWLLLPPDHFEIIIALTRRRRSDNLKESNFRRDLTLGENHDRSLRQSHAAATLVDAQLALVVDGCFVRGIRLVRLSLARDA
ncbi:MAG: hypothetical protein N2C14_26985 [Planctomycetales bacterium]